MACGTPQTGGCSRPRTPPCSLPDWDAWPTSDMTCPPPPLTWMKLSSAARPPWGRRRLSGPSAAGGGPGAPRRARLERWRERMGGEGRRGEALGARLTLARLAWQTGRRERALSLLEPALVLSAREGYVRPFVEAGPPLVPA